MDIQKIQLEIQEKEIDYNFELAKSSMETHDKWLNRLADERRKDWLLIAKIAFAFVLIFMIGLALLLYFGFSELVFEIIKVALYVVLIGSGSYGLGFSRGRSKEKEESSSD